MSIDLLTRKKLKKRTISLMDDWVFKAVIGDPEDEVCLSSFFHAIDPDFRKVRLLPGEKKAGHPDDKAIRYDICGVINEKIYFDLEVQRNGNPEEQGIRIVFYLSRLLSGQRTKGKDYRELRPVRVIMITNFRFFDDPEVSSDVFYLVGEKTGRTLTKHIQVSIIELAGVERLQRIPVQDLTPLDRWRIVLKFAGDPDKAAWIQAIMAIDEGCRRAVEKMMEIPMSMIEYMWETKRLDREMMRNSEIREERERAVKKARERALKQGKDQGVLLNLVTIVLKKAKKGMRAAEIADMLEEEKARIQTILKIKEEHPDYTEEQIAMKMISESVYPATLRNKERLNEENGKFPLA